MSRNRTGPRVTQVIIAVTVSFLAIWLFVEYFSPLKSPPSAPPGTTFRSASEVGATVSPSDPAAPANTAEAMQEGRQKARP
jgi:hypothetical protein